MTMSFFARGIALACLVAAVPQAAAETFALTNGQVINGTVVALARQHGFHQI